MANLLPSLSQRVIPQLGSTPAEAGGIHQWFSRGSYNVALDPSTNNILLTNIIPREIFKYLSFDHERFALASWESFSAFRVEAERYKFSAWPLLKIYYSAFFAAHAIMRSVGCAVVNIEHNTIENINYIANANIGKDPKLSSGTYYFQIIRDSMGSLVLELSSPAQGSGVHDKFWKSFDHFLRDCADYAVRQKLPNATDLISGVTELRPYLIGWLSTRRNEINYQQKYDAWFPAEKGGKILEHLNTVCLSSSKNIRLVFNDQNRIKEFIQATQYLSCLNYELSEFISNRSTKAHTFGSKWRRLTRRINSDPSLRS